MKNDFVTRLPGWLSEFNLPEPETAYPVDFDGDSINLDLAYPEDQLGILLVPSGVGVFSGDGWTIWRCWNVEEARAALLEIARRMDVALPSGRLDFGRVEDLFSRDLLDLARDELDNLQAQISTDHPDWDVCEDWGQRIHKRERQARRAAPRPDDKPNMPTISAAQLLRADGTRLERRDLPVHNFLGLFTPIEQIELAAIDAVWVATVLVEQVDVWPATVKGHPTYEHDSAWELVETDTELLNGMLQRLEDRITFIWNSEQAMPLLQAWHFRSTGTSLPDTLQVVDLRALCLVAFPSARQVDSPESMCQERGLSFRDAHGLGGPLAAMEALVSACASELQGLDDSCAQPSVQY